MNNSSVFRVAIWLNANVIVNLFIFIYLLCFASKHHTIIALKKLGHHNSLTPITVGPLQNININIENRNN
jgi:hypothetical protein